MKEWIISYKLLKRQEKELHGKLGEFLRPKLSNLHEMAPICRKVMEQVEGDWHPTDVAIAVVLRLYSPESLLTTKRVRRGVTRALSHALRINYSYTSQLIGDVRVRYQVITPFRHEVERHIGLLLPPPKETKMV